MLDKIKIFELIKNGTREQLIAEVILPMLLRIEELEQELKRLKEQNSRNSSLPPSRDKQSTKRRTNSLRKKSKKKTGGQKGHTGNTLQMNEHVDHVVDYAPIRCEHCQTELSSQDQQLIERKQVWDIPPVELEVTEHRRYKRKCGCCKQWTDGEYLEELQQGGQVRYGKNLVNQVIYLSTRQYLPYQRIVELVQILYGVKISEGTIDNMIRSKAAGAMDVYQQVIDRVGKSQVVGVDESGCSVEGKKHWAWAWVTSQYALFHIADHRGQKTTDSLFPEGLAHAVLTSDCWKTHLNTNAKDHQLCLAHLRRECKALIQFDHSRWASQLDHLLQNIFRLSSKYRISSQEKVDVEAALDNLLNCPLSKSTHNVKKLKQRLINYRNFITVCLYNRNVPPDNNWTERAIRMIKLKTKISGTFRSSMGARCFAVLRTIVDSAIKQNIHPSF